MVRSWKHHMFGIIYSILLAAFTVYALLDVFVISHRYVAVVQAETVFSAGEVPEDIPGANANVEAGDFPGNMSDQPAQQIKITDTEYADGNITITLVSVKLAWAVI